MLSDNWRIVTKNETGVTIDANKITIKWRGKKFASGALTLGSESSNILSQSSTLSSNAFLASATQDNGTDKYLEADATFSADLSANTATPNGDVIFYLQKATADTPTWPTDGLGQVVCVLNFPNSKVARQETKTVK